MKWRRNRQLRFDCGDGDQLRIAPATQRDVPAIGTLYMSVGWSAPGGIRSRDEFLLARRGRDLVGVLLYWLEEPDLYTSEGPPAPYAASRRLWVAELVVAEQARRSGVGRALIRAAAGVADSAGIGWMRTWPSPNGPDAERAGRIAFFTACGMDPWRPSADLLEMVARTRSVLDATAAGP